MKMRLYTILNSIYFTLYAGIRVPVYFLHEFSHAFINFLLTGNITCFKNISLRISVKNNILNMEGDFTYSSIYNKRWQSVCQSLAPFLIPLTTLVLLICFQNLILLGILLYELYFWKNTFPSPNDYLNAERAIKDPEWHFNQMFYDREYRYPDFKEDWKIKKD